MVFTLTILLISPSTAGIPRVTSGTRSLPAYVAAGIPAEYVLLLGASNVITDVFMTLLNSTGYMTATVIIHRFAKGAPAREASTPARTAPATVSAAGQPPGLA